MIRIPDPEDLGTSFALCVSSGSGRGVNKTTGSASVSSVRPLLRGSFGGGGCRNFYFSNFFLLIIV